jgi:hypothetical protein
LKPMTDQTLPIVVAFGGGTNSTAMLCGFRERDIKPDLICFADTGGELPHTYEHVATMSAKCLEWWGMEIEIVRKLYRGEFEGLEAECNRGRRLPSLAYGFKGCSVKFKGEPQDRRIRQWMDAGGVKLIRKAIGFDLSEAHRMREKYDKPQPIGGRGRQFLVWFPLIDWRWYRADCYAAIARHGIKQPGKSSCFFCPAMKRVEILRLRAEHPEYYERALVMEGNLDVRGRVRGLSMGVPWSELVSASDEQANLFDWIGEHATPAAPCGCYDGGGEDEPRP